ncbi:uncharacterized protein G2W53_040685 [Senna tora]|uniref:Uncharacterized protein n=1 Tax=Senna tora TaxID=362788 RepID=A0A834W277_9FABA|nr:uncharacterized protein G2W53_040685 [Senna tora]
MKATPSEDNNLKGFREDGI